MSSPSTSFTVEQLGKESSAEVPYGTIVESNKLIYPQILGGFYSVTSGQKIFTVSEIMAGNLPTLQNGNLVDSVNTSMLSTIAGRQ